MKTTAAVAAASSNLSLPVSLGLLSGIGTITAFVNYRTGLNEFFERNCLAETESQKITPVVIKFKSDFASQQSFNAYRNERAKWQNFSALEIVIGELKADGRLLEISSHSDNSTYAVSSFRFSSFASAREGYALIAGTIDGTNVPDDIKFSIIVQNHIFQCV